MSLVPGSRLGPYEIRGTLGAGGMGTVYRAHDPRLARDVALKILPENVARDADSLARFTREVDQARAALAELEARATTEYVQHLHFAVVHSALGEMDRAFQLLELAVRDHNGWIGCPRVPMFENFRKDPRYAEHLRRIGHPDAEWASTTR